MRWHEQPAGVMSGGGQRFEMVLARYWSNVTRMSLQCVLTVCSKTSSTSSDQIPPVCHGLMLFHTDQLTYE